MPGFWHRTPSRPEGSAAQAGLAEERQAGPRVESITAGVTEHAASEPGRTQSERYAHVRDLTQAALRQAIDSLGDGKRSSDHQLGELLRTACDGARREGLRAEQFLLIVKQAWQPLAENQFPDRAHANAAMSDVITLCIKEFYRMEQRT